MLQDPEVSGKLTPESILELARQAGYSEEQAQRWATDQANLLLDKQTGGL